MSDESGWFVMDRSNCARCHGEHSQLVFKAFQIPMVVEGVTLSHWATCPETGEPIVYGMVKP